jgi:predicted small lipoprotein YifL
MRKFIVSSLAAVTLGFALTACGGSGSPAVSADDIEQAVRDQYGPNLVVDCPDMDEAVAKHTKVVCKDVYPESDPSDKEDVTVTFFGTNDDGENSFDVQ